jgi:hypothetical protein
MTYLTSIDAREIVENHAFSLASTEAVDNLPPTGYDAFQVTIAEDLAITGWTGDDYVRLLGTAQEIGYHAYMSAHKAAHETLNGGNNARTA